MCGVLFSLFSFTWLVLTAQQTGFVLKQQIQEIGGGEARSFVMGNYGYFIVSGGNNGVYNCVQNYSWIYKYNAQSQLFDKVYTFSNCYAPIDFYPFTINGKVENINFVPFFLLLC